MKQQETKNIKPSYMENFPANIMQVLQANGICCACDPKKGVVLVFRDGEYGELFSMYAIEGERIVNNSIYSIAVPDNQRRQVESYLSELKGSSFHFYIDSVTRCIAFYSEYQTGVDEAVSIANFCLHAYNTCIDNQQALCNLAGTNAHKGATC